MFWSCVFDPSACTCVQGRRADLEVQQRHSKENPEELQYQHHCAWLWSDTLVKPILIPYCVIEDFKCCILLILLCQGSR